MVVGWHWQGILVFINRGNHPVCWGEPQGYNHYKPMACCDLWNQDGKKGEKFKESLEKGNTG